MIKTIIHPIINRRSKKYVSTVINSIQRFTDFAQSLHNLLNH